MPPSRSHDAILPEGADDLLVAVPADLATDAERFARKLSAAGKADQVRPFLVDLVDHPDDYRDDDRSVAVTWALRVDAGVVDPATGERLNTATDLDLASPVDPVVPEIGWRADGAPMLYRCRVHALNGESESGKSWIAAHLASQLIGRGRGVLIVDWEDEASSWAERLRALGATHGAVRHVAAQVPFTDADWTDNLRWMADHRCDLVIIDGVTEALGAHGLDEIRSADVARWFRAVPTRFAVEGSAAVLLIDHLSRVHAGRDEKYAAGNRHKRAAITGAAWTVTVQQTFGVGRRGVSVMTVAKDRPGRVRSACAEDGTTFAEFVLDGAADGTAVASLERAAGSAGLVRVDVQACAMVSWFVARNAGASIDEIVSGVDAPPAAVRSARDRLVRLGFVRVERSDGGGPRGHFEVRPYDPAEDPGVVAPAVGETDVVDLDF